VRNLCLAAAIVLAGVATNARAGTYDLDLTTDGSRTNRPVAGVRLGIRTAPWRPFTAALRRFDLESCAVTT
jgi:hypothetical protein